MQQERRKRAANQGPKEEKVPLPVLFQTVADAMNHSPFSTLPEFPERFGIYLPALGAPTPVTRSSDDVLALVDNNGVIDRAIMNYCNGSLGARPDYRWSAKTVREARDFWAMATPAIAGDVKMVRWLSERGLCFNRLPWDLGGLSTPTTTPTWHALMGRMTNSTAFRLWLGSIFFEEARNHQYVWMVGRGGDGKGAINRFLSRVFGNAYCAKQPPAKGDKFWTYGLIGKRLVAYPDCNAAGFVAGGLFKSLTGDDPIDVEAKGRMSFTYRPIAKHIFFSNENPRISSENAHTRRIIFCEFTGAPEERDPEFEAKLWNEGGLFLTGCIQDYIDAYPNHGDIDTEGDELGDLLSQLEEPYEEAFTRHLGVVQPPYDTSAALSDLSDDDFEQRCVRPARMQEILHFAFKDERSREGFMKWLQVKHHVKKTTVRRGFKTPKVYVGVGEIAASRPSS